MRIKSGAVKVSPSKGKKFCIIPSVFGTSISGGIHPEIIPLPLLANTKASAPVLLAVNMAEEPSIFSSKVVKSPSPSMPLTP